MHNIACIHSPFPLHLSDRNSDIPAHNLKYTTLLHNWGHIYDSIAHCWYTSSGGMTCPGHLILRCFTPWQTNSYKTALTEWPTVLCMRVHTVPCVPPVGCSSGWCTWDQWRVPHSIPSLQTSATSAQEWTWGRKIGEGGREGGRERGREGEREREREGREGGGGREVRAELCTGFINVHIDSLFFNRDSPEDLGIVPTEFCWPTSVELLLRNKQELVGTTHSLVTEICMWVYTHLLQWRFDSNDPGGINGAPKARIIEPPKRRDIFIKYSLAVS